MVEYGFFDSINKDRLYNAKQFSAMMDGIVTDGVIMAIGDKFVAREIAGTMNVLIGSGRAWFNSKWIYNDSGLSISISPSETSLDRIDSICIEINTTVENRSCVIKTINGTPSEQPVAPTLKRDEGVYQYKICDVFVTKQASVITQSNITNFVGTSETPFVTGVVQNMNIDELLLQWDGQITDLLQSSETEILTWFVNIKDQISEDAAVHLQLQINDINTALGGRKISVVTEYPETPDVNTIYFKIEV